MEQKNKLAQLKEQKNQIEAQICAIENNATEANTVLLIQSILNLRDGLGRYFEGNYYAPKRLYTEGLEGVKNIRWGGTVDQFHLEQGNFPAEAKDQQIVKVKITGQAGYLLPEQVTMPNGERIWISLSRSSKYDHSR